MHCYVCTSRNSTVKIVEKPIERRFGKPVLPMDEYRQRLCLNCGLLFVDCEVTDEFLSELYKGESVEWQISDDSYGQLLGLSRLREFRKLAKKMFRIRTAKANDQLLDFGCQTGEFCSEACKISNVIPNGVEMSADYASVALQKWGRGEVHIGELTHDTFEQERFAYISAQEVLEHMTDPGKVLGIFNKTLRQDGLLLITVPSTDYFLLKKWFFSLFKRDTPVLVHTHIYNFTPKALNILVETHGFRAIEIGPTGWHGKLHWIGNFLAKIFYSATMNKFACSPSVYCLVKKVVSK